MNINDIKKYLRKKLVDEDNKKKEIDHHLKEISNYPRFMEKQTKKKENSWYLYTMMIPIEKKINGQKMAK